MNKIDILFLIFIITTGIALIICMCLISCKRESTPNGSPQSSKIFNIDGCGIYYVEVIHDNHEYLISNYGGTVHKVNCKFCKK